LAGVFADEPECESGGDDRIEARTGRREEDGKIKRESSLQELRS
jgi:hypothetical protein